MEWAIEYNADYIIGETFNDFGEALLALEAIKAYSKGKDLTGTCTAQINKCNTRITKQKVKFPLNGHV